MSADTPPQTDGIPSALSGQSNAPVSFLNRIRRVWEAFFSASAKLDESRLEAFSRGAITVLLILISLPLWTGRVPVFGDFGAYHLPIRDFYASCLAEGDAFDWAPGIHGGCFIVGEGEAGLYHPWHYVLYRFLPLDRAFALESASSFAMLVLGIYFFLKGKAGTIGALFGALVYGFSSNFIGHAQHVNHVAVLAHLPWVLRLLDIGFDGDAPIRRNLAFLAIAVLTGSQCLLGHPQAMSFSLLAEACYALYLFWFVPRSALRLVAFSGSLVLGAMIGAVQLLATYAFFFESNREQFDPMLGSFYPTAFLQLLGPYLLGREVPMFSGEWMYVGMVPILLTIFWIATYRLHATDPADVTAEMRFRESRFGWFALALAFLAAWLATGCYGGLYKLQTLLPVVGKLRAPLRYVNLLDFGLAIVAALGFNRVLSFVRQGRQIGWGHLIPLWVAVGLTSGLAIGFSQALPAIQSHSFHKALYSAPLLMLLAATALSMAARGRPAGLFLLLILACLDLGLFGLGLSIGRKSWLQVPTFAEWKENVSTPPGASGGRILSYAGQPQKLMHVGGKLINGYGGGLEPSKQLDYQDTTTLRVAGVEWYQHPNPAEPPPPGLDVQPTHSPEWFRVPAPLPRARVVSDVLVSQSPRNDLRAIDVDRTALVTRPLTLSSGTPGAATIETDRPGRLQLVTNTPGRQLLVVNESFSPGWQVTVDGISVPTERVNGDFLGCVVDAGEHHVEFVFKPAALYYGRLGSLSGLGLTLLLAACSVVMNRRQRARADKLPSRTDPTRIAA